MSDKHHGTTDMCSNGQLATIASRIVVALPKALLFSGIDTKSILRHTDNGEHLSFALSEALKMLYNGSGALAPILRPISESERFIIEAVDGTETLADVLFRHPEINKPGKATEETVVQFYKLERNATFAQMFGSIETDLDKLCLSQHQIKVFCNKYDKLLHDRGCATSFLSKYEDQFFVVSIGLHMVGLLSFFHRFNEDTMWSALDRHCVVVPKLSV